MNKRALALVVAVVAGITVVACSDDDTTQPVSKIVTFKATLTGAAERPNAVTTAGTGTFTATLDTSTNVFTYDVTFTGLTSPVNNGHIHGPSDANSTNGAILNFNTLAGATFSFGLQAGTARGTVTLNAATQINQNVNGDSLKKLLFAGLTYANIHTTTNTGGEIRGQITKQ